MRNLQTTGMAALLGLVALAEAITSTIVLPPLPSGYNTAGLPVGPPLAAPDYMVNNQGNAHKAAPDRGSMNGPVIDASGMSSVIQHRPKNSSSIAARQSSNCASWICDIAHGEMPLAPSGYQFFRNVKDFGAVGDGVTDDTEAINRAASAFSSSNNTVSRCGENCGSTSVLGAIVYFPPGVYIVSTPIIQYYYTQFIGDLNDKPTIKGDANFTGIALIDTDVYIPDGNGSEWYINQNQFFRQIRNFKIDLTAMPRSNTDNQQTYVPCGIHWQVAQATSLQNIDFVMPVSDASGATTAVGLFMENGSGGFLSDLTFVGGNIGFRAGSQQYTARNLTFTSCLTAISSIWNWGFTWKDIYVFSTYVAIDCTSVGGTGDQGTGSISVLDSHFNYVPYPITLRSGGPYPGIVLDNLLVENSASVVLISGGETIVEGSTDALYFTSWAMGSQYTSTSGGRTNATGFVSPAPVKPEGLLDSSSRIFTRSRPQYEGTAAGSFVVATANGIANDGTGDQTDAINSLLTSSVGQPVFFPAGIYQVQGTVNIPVGSIIIGHGWSQIRGTGSYFQDASNPQVMVKVGNIGDSGVIEISDMLFTVKGPTAGAILMEWNVHESTQGSAGMWDSHFRVGGAAGSDLQLDNCPKIGADTATCMAASLILHLTPDASGYFENVWVWAADHDMDNSLNALISESDSGVPSNVQTSVSVFSGRGVLIESQGPSWFYASASEHSSLYQYQLYGADNIFFGHMQTETPYYQPNPDASQPYKAGLFPEDPTFADCEAGSNCEKAWALRIINSNNVLIYGAGFYSFFQNWDESCLVDETCQSALVETSFSQGLWIYNIFTVGAEQVITPRGGIPPTLQSDNQAGFSTEVTVWLVLSTGGGDLGGDGGPDQGSDIVYIDPTVYLEPSPTVGCWPPCTLVFPPSTLQSETTISLPPITTTVTVNSVTTVTTITVAVITTSVISFWPWSIGGGETSTTSAISSSLRPPPVTVSLGGTITTLTLPAYTGFGPGFPFSVSNEAQPTTTSSTSIVYYSLPTTVVTSGTITQTWSEGQIESLSTITTTTQITTTWYESSSGTSTSTTTVIPIWIQIGGFYWSPVPVPGPTPFPLPPLDFPDLPKLPPIPSPPCFKLFDLFSIDCPPDKTKPTTHFTSHAPTPTCTAHCGTLDNSSDQQSSTCATETNTACQTVCTASPCQTVCNTYVGCACPTSTVTDYWVSCSQSSCTTTSSAVITGCYVTATATTTGAYCPTGVTVGPDDAQNEAAPASATNSLSTTQTSEAESVVINGTPYVVSGGSIVVSGSTISVPDASGLVTTTIGGFSGVIVPGYVGPVVVANTTVTVTDWGTGSAATGPAPTTTAPTTAPTTALPPTSTTTQAAAPSPTAQVLIAYWTYCASDEISCDFNWVVYDTAIGDSVNVCSSVGQVTAPEIDGTITYPAGTLDYSPFTINGDTNCKYVGTSSSVGTWECTGFAQPVQCVSDVLPVATCFEDIAPAEVNIMVWCSWP